MSAPLTLALGRADAAGLVLAVLLLGYLVFTLIKAERF
jgi:K+-transporting ATPase KdpF subunit